MDQPSRNLVIGILAPVDAGKTTLAESILYNCKSIRKWGRVDNKDAFLDTYELEKPIILVPILRAGLGMVNGICNLIPTAKVAHIGLYRDEETLEPHTYFEKYPKNIDAATVIIVDPMLATGGSSSAAIQMLKDKGVKNIRLMCIIAAPEGVKKMQEDHPDVDVYIGALDDHLNEHGYIVPGLGDAGDRIFGTK